jgi:hypothetical protein
VPNSHVLILRRGGENGKQAAGSDQYLSGHGVVPFCFTTNLRSATCHPVVGMCSPFACRASGQFPITPSKPAGLLGVSLPELGERYQTID